MRYQFIGSFLFVLNLFRGVFSMSTLKKILSVTLSFLMLVSISYTFIETVDPEPAYASGEFSCLNSGGKAYIFQSTFGPSIMAPLAALVVTIEAAAAPIKIEDTVRK